MKELSKSITLAGLIKADIGNPNAGWPEGIVTVMKKVELPNGEVHPYISGQALRRYLRDSLAELPDVKPDEIAEITSPEISADPKAPVLTPGDPRKFIDDDLFGFMRAVKGLTILRESPLRVSAAYGLFPYTGDRDLGTKSALKALSRIAEEPKKLEELAKLLRVSTKGKSEKEIKKAVIEAAHKGAMFESEVTNNVYRTALLLELDRVGRWQPYESLDAEKGELPESERKRRCKLLLHGLKYLWGGGRRTRMLLDFTPQFVIYARMPRKVPVFLNALEVKFTGKVYEIDTEILKQVARDYEADIQKLIIGARKGFLINEDKIEILGARPQSIGEAFDAMIKDIETSSF
ncbi:MAG: hypothetical protein AOA66_1024 [Candidatus Bathyarchaeota archaeon BA2]|nr:MAG: hypothetical protein AOA66_1024 [Candidatus Bathyarchaeota archaeon BA2]